MLENILLLLLEGPILVSTEAKDAIKHSTGHRTAPQERIIPNPKCQ